MLIPPSPSPPPPPPRCAFPLDELDPIACRGRGPDREDPSNININDVLGGYSLALVESLGTLAVMGDRVRFRKAVRDVVENVSFDGGATVQVRFRTPNLILYP